MNKKLPTIYKKDSVGRIRTWCVEVNGNQYRVLSGLVGKKQTTSSWKECHPKNVGKSNETTAEEQALLEAEAEWKKKLERGYFLSELDAKGIDYYEPMLARVFDADKLPGDTLYAQPKLDGIRCIARNDGLWTRRGKQIVSCDHIYEALKPVFDKQPDLVLDGELYNHDLNQDFNKITSIVRKTKPKEEDTKLAHEYIQFHVYDMVSELPFSQRMEKLPYDIITGEENKNGIHFVETKKVHSHDDLDDLYSKWLRLGYEGQMVRLDGPYEQGKRSRFLLKRKEFISEEFSILAIEEGVGNWAGYAKRVILEDHDGKTFGAGIRGNQAQLKLLLQQMKPNWATVRYFNRTPDDVPRFPVVVDWGYNVRMD